MSNTVYQYTPTAWVDHVTLGNQARMNNLETAASVALHGINPDLSGPFVLSGITCTKDGTTANQLDIASGTAYVTLSDGTTGKIAVGADNTHTTATPSTTYYLFLLNTGAWQWGTSSTGPTNSLPICQATTDGSGNISAVTDVRFLLTGPGMPLVVQTPPEQHITTTTLLNPLWSWQPNIPGLYRISGSLYKHSGGNSYIYIRTSYWGKHSGAPSANTFAAVTGGPGITAPISLQGSASVAQLADGEYGLTTGCFYAGTGDAIKVTYQDLSGTPDDYLLFCLERLR